MLGGEVQLHLVPIVERAMSCARCECQSLAGLMLGRTSSIVGIFSHNLWHRRTSWSSSTLDFFYCHHVDLRPPEDGIIGGWDMQDAELHDDNEWIGTDWKFNHALRTCLVPIKSIEK